MAANLLLLKPSLIPRSSVIHFSSESTMATTLKVLGDRKRCKTLLSLKEEQYVASLIDVLLSRDKVLHAEPWLNKYRRQGHQFTVNVYNKLINSWLKQDNEPKASILYETMIEDGVSPDHNTFAIFIAYYSNLGKMSEVQAIISEMEAKGYSLSHLPYNTNISKEVMMSVIKLMDDLGVNVERLPREEKSYPILVQSLYNQENGDNSQSNEGRVRPDPSLLDVFSSDSFMSKIQSQLEIERRGYEVIASVAKRPNRERRNKASLQLEKLYSVWEGKLLSAIEAELKQYEADLKFMEQNWFAKFHTEKHLPFLSTLTAKQWAKIAMEKIVQNVLCQPDGLPVHYICSQILESAWAQYVVKEKAKRGIADKMVHIYKGYYEDIRGTFVGSNHMDKCPRELWNKRRDEAYLYGTVDPNIPSWPFTVGIYIGQVLIDIVLSNLKMPHHLKTYAMDSVDEDENTNGDGAFTHYYVYVEKNKQVGHLKPHPSLYGLFKKLHGKDEALSFVMSSAELPMLVPPQPWTNSNEGGYVLIPSSPVRCIEDTYQHKLLLETESDNMLPVFDSLNYLSLYPWRINNRMLDLVIHIFNNGGNDSLDIPVTDLPEIPQVPKDCDEETKGIIWKKRREVKKLHAETFSLRMDMLYKLSICNHYRNSLFWLPHNMDFRSRVYPIPPHLTHLTSDLGRSLIQFGIGHSLGKRGLEWLKIHIATLHGAKSKSPLKDRLQFTDSLLNEIADSADKPLEGNGWWRTSDEPWQTLACCIELTEALRSGDPENFVSHTPVHQDGSCNGLQHYAAMGRDIYGAQQVNLVPSDKPANLYAEVAYLVDKRRKVDAENGSEIAKVLEGKIHRKVVKQTVMTVVYGVTWVGGRLQIQKQLKDTIPDEVLFNASSYVVTQVFESLKEMFKNARAIQDWLTMSARKVALSGYPVDWVTPLGMPVIQPYHKKVYNQVDKKRLQSVSWFDHSDFTRPPNPNKQKSAMPPNFVHSLDSTHMMLTSLYCQKHGIPFVAVHDSYWTYGPYVDDMNKICREQFIGLHSEPILRDLAAHFEAKFGGLTYIDHGSTTTTKGKKVCSFMEDLPSQGDLQLDCVKDSTYFFS